MSRAKTHSRILGICGVDLVRFRFTVNDEMAVMGEVRDELERIMIDSGYLNGAPFGWVTISIRFGLKNDSEPHYQRINKKYGDLPLAIEVDAREVKTANRIILKNKLTVAALKALIGAGAKYKLSTRSLDDRMKELFDESDYLDSSANTPGDEKTDA